MRPRPFRYAAPASVTEALELLREHGDDARPLAGGQSLVAMMNLRLAGPAVLVDLGRIPELAEIRVGTGAIAVGAMARQAAVERAPEVRAGRPLVAEALTHVGHWQIRERGTVGGNLAHADPASELPAVLVALGGRFAARSAAGRRWIAADDFFVGPYTTALADGELLESVEIPSVRPGDLDGFAEVARCRGAYALAGAVVHAHVDDGLCRSVRVVAFGVGRGPLRLAGAERALVGTELDASAAERAGAAAEAEAPEHDDVHLGGRERRRLVAIAVVRAVGQAAARRRGAVPA